MRAIREGYNVIGIRRGWAGLVDTIRDKKFNNEENFVQLTRHMVDRASRTLGPGESAHIPRDVVHGTYNAGDETLVFLAMLSPAIFEGPAVVDASREEPWASLRPTSGSGTTAR